MSKNVAGYLAALLALAVLDALWLGLISREFYKARLGQLLLEQPVWSIALLFYLIHAVGMMVFPVPMALSGGTWLTAALYGALFGFFAYSAYDITNLATLRGWPFAVSLVDLAWGTFATAVASTAGYLAARAVS
ncbi:MAG: DUF2177 family protein [Proteobacteria bacterium]|nr:DUF2177 family protein [Pseudomonadota bacterium]